MRLLITRPEPDAVRTKAVLGALGHEALVAPLMRVEPIAADLSGRYAALLMTSANAARAIAAHSQRATLIKSPVLAVGHRTSEAAREAGFADVISADGAVADLVRLAAERRIAGRLVYLAGEDRAGDLGGDLAARGIAVDTVVVYRAVAATNLPSEVAQALATGSLGGALHYSARSLAVLLALSEAAGVLNAVLSLHHYCLSASIAALLAGPATGPVVVARRPDEPALIDCLIGA